MAATVLSPARSDAARGLLDEPLTRFAFAFDRLTLEWEGCPAHVDYRRAKRQLHTMVLLLSSASPIISGKLVTSIANCCLKEREIKAYFFCLFREFFKVLPSTPPKGSRIPMSLIKAARELERTLRIYHSLHHYKSYKEELTGLVKKVSLLKAKNRSIEVVQIVSAPLIESLSRRARLKVISLLQQMGIPGASLLEIGEKRRDVVWRVKALVALHPFLASPIPS